MEQKRNVILMDEHEALVDGHQKKNSETAIPRDVRTNTADESCMKQR